MATQQRHHSTKQDELILVVKRSALFKQSQAGWP